MSFAAPARALSRDEVRAVDEKAIAMGLPGICLMENAALGLTNVVCEELVARGAGAGAVVGIVAKTGNNGGDGFVLARQLLLRGYAPRVAYCGDRANAKRDTDVRARTCEHGARTFGV
jgi:NAD(P)H-hydrate repair Nnr-like enzyme with NAD(P)H-hydrate epimerase domain